PLTTPVLPGVARKAVLEIAVREAIQHVEQDLFINSLLEAEEVFITNVIMGIMPVVGIEAHAVGSGRVGQVTARLMKCYEELVKNRCGKELAEGGGE
ncbi:MAG TPA: aminotransferase class IV, partial [Sedimentisphaerales bacterium]|nr:aminotransferase class IV [Sedimentisphaerales bacterium]